MLKKFNEYMIIEAERKTGLEAIKDKDEKLNDFLKRTEVLLQSAKTKGEKNREKLYQDRIKYIKSKISANKKRINIEKRKEIIKKGK